MQSGYWWGQGHSQERYRHTCDIVRFCLEAVLAQSFLGHPFGFFLREFLAKYLQTVLVEVFSFHAQHYHSLPFVDLNFCFGLRVPSDSYS